MSEIMRPVPIRVTDTDSGDVFRKDDITISMANPSSANDAFLVSEVTAIVNRAYAEVESDIFKPGYERTNVAEIAQLIRDGTLALAVLEPKRSHHDSETSEKIAPSESVRNLEVVGCVQVKQLSSSLGNFAMFAVDARFCGRGLGRKMVAFVEDHCRRLGCVTMQLEILEPTWMKHANKMRMEAWYQRLGYRIVKLGNFGDEYPALLPLLAGPCAYKIFEKELS